MAFVSSDIVGKAEARRPRILEIFAVVAGADVVVHVNAAGQQTVRPGLSGICGIVRVQGCHELCRSDIVGVGRILFVIPADAEIQCQLVVDLPVVLNEEAVLFTRGHDTQLLSRDIEFREVLHLVRRGGDSVLVDFVEELRVDRVTLQRCEFDVLVAGSDLDGVVAVPVQIGKSKVVRNRPPFLAAEASVETSSGAGLDDGPLFGDFARVIPDKHPVNLTVSDRRHRRADLVVLCADQEFVEPRIGAVLPSQGRSLILVRSKASMFERSLAAAYVKLRFVAHLSTEFDPVAIGDIPADLAEIQVFLERRHNRAEGLLDVLRQELHECLGICSRGHHAWSNKVLLLVGDEEVHAVT